MRFVRRPKFLLIAAFVAASMANMTLPALAAGGNPDAEAFVDGIASRAIQILSDKSLTASAREDAFRELLQTNAELDRIGVFALGQYARTTTPDQRQKYLELVREFIVKIYLSRLTDYSNEKFIILGSVPKGSKEVIVSSKIEFTNGREPVTVDWRLLSTNQGYKIFDVKVVGIWMAQEQRDAFTSVIRNNNGNFDALLAHIQRQISDGVDKPATAQASTAN